MAIEYSLDPTRNTWTGLPENPLSRQVRELAAERDAYREALAALVAADDERSPLMELARAGISGEEARAWIERSNRANAMQAAAANTARALLAGTVQPSAHETRMAEAARILRALDESELQAFSHGGFRPAGCTGEEEATRWLPHLVHASREVAAARQLLAGANGGA